LKSPLSALLYKVRDLRSGALFSALAQYCRGKVLDVGGWDFYLTARKREVQFESWTVFDLPDKVPPAIDDPRVRFVGGDGCKLDFPDHSFDTVLSIQTLEHVFDPNQMFAELCRVLKPGGHLIVLAPATSTLHMAPHHYYNFTIFWFAEALHRSRMETLTLTPLGGRWSSLASHLVYFFLQSFHVAGMTVPGQRRSPLFWLMFPLMATFAILAIPICLMFSLADLGEEPNNHLAIARKPGDANA
jgi:SAM-dependent methyltransferase